GRPSNHHRNGRYHHCGLSLTHFRNAARDVSSDHTGSRLPIVVHTPAVRFFRKHRTNEAKRTGHSHASSHLSHGGGTGAGYQPQGNHPNSSSSNKIKTTRVKPPPGAEPQLR